MTLEQINQLANCQLTQEEIMLLKIRVNIGPNDMSKLLKVTPISIHRALKRAHQKIATQRTLDVGLKS